MKPETTATQPVTIVATPNGLVLSTPTGEFKIQSTSQESKREFDPVDLFGIQDSDPHALLLQTGKFAV